MALTFVGPSALVQRQQDERQMLIENIKNKDISTS